MAIQSQFTVYSPHFTLQLLYLVNNAYNLPLTVYLLRSAHVSRQKYLIPDFGKKYVEIPSIALRLAVVALLCEIPVVLLWTPAFCLSNLHRITQYTPGTSEAARYDSPAFYWNPCTAVVTPTTRMSDQNIQWPISMKLCRSLPFKCPNATHRSPTACERANTLSMKLQYITGTYNSIAAVCR